jgi:hypothetical protein
LKPQRKRVGRTADVRLRKTFRVEKSIVNLVSNPAALRTTMAIEQYVADRQRRLIWQILDPNGDSFYGTVTADLATDAKFSGLRLPPCKTFAKRQRADCISIHTDVAPSGKEQATPTWG